MLGVQEILYEDLRVNRTNLGSREDSHQMDPVMVSSRQGPAKVLEELVSRAIKGVQTQSVVPRRKVVTGVEAPTRRLIVPG